MNEKFKDLMFFGVGSLSLAKDVATDFVDEMIRAGKAQQEQREQLLAEMAERARVSQAHLEELVAAKVEQMARDMHLVPKGDYEKLLARVQKLEEQLASKTQDKP